MKIELEINDAALAAIAEAIAQKIAGLAAFAPKADAHAAPAPAQPASAPSAPAPAPAPAPTPTVQESIEAKARECINAVYAKVCGTSWMEERKSNARIKDLVTQCSNEMKRIAYTISGGATQSPGKLNEEQFIRWRENAYALKADGDKVVTDVSNLKQPF